MSERSNPDTQVSVSGSTRSAHSHPEVGKNPIKFLLGSAFGSGLLPVAPGTWGSLTVLLPAWFVTELHLVSGLTALLIFTLLAGFYAADWFESRYGKDPSGFVMDEWAGQLIPLYALLAWPTPTVGEKLILFLAAFLLFRFFDILKPLGINQIQHLRGAAGIMLDDLLAGFYAFCTLFFAIFAYLNLF